MGLFQASRHCINPSADDLPSAIKLVGDKLMIELLASQGHAVYLIVCVCNNMVLFNLTCMVADHTLFGDSIFAIYLHGTPGYTLNHVIDPALMENCKSISQV